MEAVDGTSPTKTPTEQKEPPVSAVWFHSHGRIWVPFSEDDIASLEETWDLVKDELGRAAASRPVPVSYTHLTLPTIYSV